MPNAIPYTLIACSRGVRMHMLVYLILAAIVYGVLADRTDRAVDREMQKRRADSTDLGLVEDFDVRPDLGLRYGRRLMARVRHPLPNRGHDEADDTIASKVRKR